VAESPEYELPAGVECRRNVPYGTGGDTVLKADLYLPAGERQALSPAVVFVHGGGWRNRNRQQFAPQAAAMAKLGFVGLCIEYRLAQEARYPAALMDTKCAVRFLKARAPDLGVAPERIGIAGGSAGGHLAVLTALTPSLSHLEGTGGHAAQSSAVAAVVAFNPVLDLRELDDTPGVRQFMGGSRHEVGEALYEEASPICQVGPGAPPMLLLHGDADSTVPHHQSVRFCEALEAAGGTAELFTAPGAAHAFFNRPPWFEPTLDRMTAFFQKHLGQP